MSNAKTGTISSSEAYSKAMLMQRLGISQRFWDKMLDEGLPFTSVGHSRWVAGCDVIEFFRRRSEVKNDSNSTRSQA